MPHTPRPLHCRFSIRSGSEKRAVLSLKPEVAPVKCSVFPQMKSVGTVVCLQISEKLTALGISNAVRCP